MVFLIVDLLPLKDFDFIFVVVDQLTKMVHFVPRNKRIIGEKTTKLFIDNVYKYHCFLDGIISDCST